MNKTKMLDQFASILFLRPENVFTSYRQVEAILKTDFRFDEEPSLDISCGDGLFTFILLGGELIDEFDTFIDIEDEAVHALNKNSRTDIFNSLNKSVKINPVKSPSAQKITYGTDWKDILLKKAGRLGLYRNLLLHNNNTTFPFEDDMFKRVYANSLHWVENIEFHLEDIFRITAPGGKVLLQVSTDRLMEDHPFNWDLPWLSQGSKALLDRKRYEVLKCLKPKKWWLAQLKKTGFTVKQVVPTYSREQLAVWHVGLRPIAHFLVLLFNRLNPLERVKLKKEFIAYMRPLIRDISRIEPKQKDSFRCTIMMERKK